MEALGQTLTALDRPADPALVADEATPIFRATVRAEVTARFHEEFSDVLTVCPRCKAKAGECCRTKSGAKLHRWHVARKSA